MTFRHALFVGAALLAIGCSSRRTFDMSWKVAASKTCADEVTLRYTVAPNYFEVLCSAKLATALKAAGKSIVPMVARHQAAGYSICEIAGIVDDPPTATCAFQGQISGGHDGAPTPAPWD